jgi:hypothetical protein
MMIGNTFRSKKYNINPSTGRYDEQQQQNALGGADWAGMGLQLYGSSMQDKATQEELERQQEQERLAIMMEGRRGRAGERQSEQQMQQTERSQNMAGFGMLANQRERAMQNRRQYSFRNSFIKAMGA